jgi:CheY-like chemotaxis protein
MSGPARVLIVDDEEEVRDLLGQIFLGSGYVVDRATGGREALRKMQAAHPDLILLYLMMPDMSGFEVLEKLKGMKDVPPVLVLTAREDASAFTRAVSMGAAAYVSKPFGFEELLTTCRKVLGVAARVPPRVAEERRTEPRRALLTAVTVLSRDRRPIAKGELHDLSSGGAQVELGTQLTPGTRVWVGFHAGGLSLSLECRVAWCGPPGPRTLHGLAFMNLSAEQAKPIRELLGGAAAG